MCIAKPLAHRRAYLRRFRRLGPDHRIGAGNVREFELVDAGGGIFRLLRARIVQRRHILAAADALKPAVCIAVRASGDTRAALLGCQRVFRDGRVALTDITRPRKNPAQPVQLRGAELVHF